MEIILNGSAHQVGEDASISVLVKSLDLKGRRVAVMINEQVVKRDHWNEVRIQSGDAVEVIQMVGGG